VLAQAASSLTIDNFEEGTITDSDLSTAAGTTLQENAGLNTANVVGGVRLTSVEATSGGVGVTTGAAALVPTPADDSVALTTVGTLGTSDFQFIYDGIANGSNNGSGGALNLNLTGFNSIDVTASASSVTATLQLTLYTSTIFQTSSKPLANGVTSFVLGGAINFADIQAIRLAILGIDVGEAPTITDISAVAVPEPAAGLLVAAGLVGLGLRRRRSD
jgi:hypothetical protein